MKKQKLIAPIAYALMLGFGMSAPAYAEEYYEITAQAANRVSRQASQNYWQHTASRTPSAPVYQAVPSQRVEIHLPEHRAQVDIPSQQQQYYANLEDFVQQHILNSKKSAPSAKSGGGFILPVKYTRISSPFGKRIHPIHKVEKMHTGVDYAAPEGTPIKAARAGTVVFSGWKNGYGNTVVIQHDNKFSTLYGHNRSNSVRVGQKVRAGELIAHVGTTGHTTGPHLHFEVLENGRPINPQHKVGG